MKVLLFDFSEQALKVKAVITMIFDETFPSMGSFPSVEDPEISNIAHKIHSLP